MDVEVLITLKVLPKILHRELLIVGYVDIVNLLLLKECLLITEDLFEEVFVDLRLGWEIILYY